MNGTADRLPTRVPRASLDFTKWLEQQRDGKRALPEWVVCNRTEDARDAEDGYGPDPDADAPEWARPCELCGTACYVKGAFVIEGFRVADWVCFRRAGGRQVMFHPVQWAEIEAAGHAKLAWELIGEMRAWLAEPDTRAAHAAVEVPARWRRFTRAVVGGMSPE